SRTTSPRRPWRTSSATRRKPLMSAAIYSTAGVMDQWAAFRAGHTTEKCGGGGVAGVKPPRKAAQHPAAAMLAGEGGARADAEIGNRFTGKDYEDVKRERAACCY